MDRKKEIENELENLSPFLAEMKKKDSFKVPENYFAELSANVWEEVQKEKVVVKEVSPVVTTPSWMEQMMQSIAVLFQPRMALSLASVAVLVLAGIFWMNNQSTELVLAANEDPTIEETTNYLAANIDDFDIDLLMEIEMEESDLVDLYDYDLDFNEEDLDAILNDLLDDFNENTFDELL